MIKHLRFYDSITNETVLRYLAALQKKIKPIPCLLKSIGSKSNRMKQMVDEEGYLIQFLQIKTKIVQLHFLYNLLQFSDTIDHFYHLLVE